MDKKDLNIIWRPSEKDLKSSAMARFKDLAEKAAQKPLLDFSDLYSWSIAEPKIFWDLVVKFTEITFTSPPSITLDTSHEFWKASWYPGATLNYSERILRPAQSSELASKVAIICWDENGERSTLTFKELADSVAKLAGRFSSWGVVAGDVVAGLLNNTAHAVIGMLAASKLGAIWTSCSPDFGSSAIKDRFEQVSPKILIAATSYFEGAAPITSSNAIRNRTSCEAKIADVVSALPSLERLVLLEPSITIESTLTDSGNPLKIVSWKDTQQSLSQQPTVPNQQYKPLPFDHPLVILYSSGTTGKPKCIVHRAGGVLLEHLKEHILHVGLTDQDTIFYYTSTSWMMWNWLVSGLATGATIVLFDGSPAARDWRILWDLSAAEQVTIFGTSAKYLSVIEHRGIEPRRTHKLDSLRLLLSTGSPLLEHSFDYIQAKIKGSLQISSISGGTDLVGCFALGNPLTPVYRGELQARSLGLAVNVYNSDGKPVINQQGELVCEAPFPSMPLKFWNDSQDERYQSSYFKRFPGVWHHGDFVTLTDRGTMIFHGRSDATLNPGGVRIGTAEIYAQLNEQDFPEIVDAVAVGKNTQKGEEIVLLVQLKPEVQLTEALKDRIKGKILDATSKYHVPKHIVAVPEIPRTHNHKIAEMAVADVVNGRAVRNVGGLANPEALEKIRGLTAGIL